MTVGVSMHPQKENGRRETACPGLPLRLSTKDRMVKISVMKPRNQRPRNQLTELDNMTYH